MHRLFVSHKVVRRKGNKMKISNEKNYVVIEGVKVEVSAEVDKAYRNMQDAIRIKQQRHGECCCPRSKWFKCSTDCTSCPYKITSDISLDGIYSEDGVEYGDEFLFQQTKNEYVSFETSYTDNEERKLIIKRVYEMMPELIEFGRLKLEGYTYSKISEMLGIKRSTLDSRIRKVYSIIIKEFPNAKF